jgi:hypothetical protein
MIRVWLAGVLLGVSEALLRSVQRGRMRRKRRRAATLFFGGL